MARLVVETGPEAGMVYQIGAQPLVIGRSVDCDLQVMDRRVSRKHAVIKGVGGSCMVEDLFSRNGTFLNHQPLSGATQLRTGDRVAVGGTVLLFEVDPADLEAPRARLRRVRMAPGGDHTLQAEKSIDADTAPIISQAPVSRELMSDPMQRLRVLYQVAESLRAELDLDTLLSKIMDIIWLVVNPDRGIILIADSTEGIKALRPAVVKLKRESNEDIIISQGIVERSLHDRSAVLMADAPSDERFSENDSIFAGSIRSAICTPLIANGQSFGVIYIDTQETDGGTTASFSGEDLELVSGIAVQAALAIQNARLHHDALKHQRLERELEIARDIQVSLLPHSFPELDDLTFAATCLPARQVGGDYYDCFKMADNKLAVVIGDASGKGVPAAILISTVRAACRAQAQVHSPGNVADIVKAINKSLCSDSETENFVSLFMMIYDLESHDLSYTNGGHVPPLLVRKNGDYIKLEEGGPLLGVSEDSTYQQSIAHLSGGDAIVLYTDGVTDTHNLHKELFSDERLIEMAVRKRGNDAATICDSILQSVVQFRKSTEPFDDLTLLIMKAT